MKTIKLSCPHCNATIDETIGNRREIFCSYCGGKILIDDEVQRTEHKEEKKVSVNKRTEYVNKAEVIKAKNQKTLIKSLTVIYSILLVICAIFFARAGYHQAETKSVSISNDALKVMFAEAILGTAEEKMDLIVMEEDISVKSTITKEGLFEWSIFKKDKDVTYVGKAIYTVDLSRLRENDIIVDEDEKTVTIYVPKPELYDLLINPSDFTLGDTNKGLLSFGDIKMTLEEAFYIENEAVNMLKENAGSKDLMDLATERAEQAVIELFSASVNSVDSEYTMNIEMY